MQELPAKLKNFSIRTLSAKDAEIISVTLLNAPKTYNRYFQPFLFDLKEITTFLDTAKRDRYFGVFEEEDLAGLYMLRGLDAGYETPSYGVWIAPHYSNLGLAQLTLVHAFCICRLNQISRLMLKVHPQNIIAKNIYEKFGFEPTGVDFKNGNIVYHKSWE